MAAAGSLNITDIGLLSFASVESASGWPFDFANAETEPMESAGVDGLRWRTKRNQYREWPMRTYSAGSTSYALAREEARKYLSAVGRIGNLSLTIAGTTYAFSKIHIELASYKVVSAPIVGPTTNASSVAYVVADWALTFTELSSVPT